MKAAFFDMDGTIIDSRADLAATVNHTRRDLGLADLPQAEILRYVGQGAKRLLARSVLERPGEVLPEGVASRSLDELLEIFMSHYAEHMVESVKLYPGVAETLAALRADGWLLGVNTAKPNFATHAILERLGIAEYFGDAVIAGGDCAEMKPSALPLVECSARLGHVLAADDWMVGDNWTDLECGANAGVKTAFCAFGFGVLKGCRFDAELAAFPDLLRFV